MTARRKHALFALLAVALLVAVAEGQEPFYLRGKDRVIFYGDSITEPRLYTTFVETYAVTRFPSLEIEFMDSAWGGDRVTGGRGGAIDVRLQRDVVAHKPTVVAIMLGANDGWGLPYEAKRFETFASGYQHIVATIKASLPSVRLTLMQPAPRDEVTRPPEFGGGGYNGVMIRYGAFVRKLARREGLASADLNSPLVAVLVEAEASDHALAQRIGGDGTHPGLAGHLILAAALLKAWHAPAIVSAVEIDAAHLRTLRADNTAVRSLAMDVKLSWTQDDHALPFPIDVSDPAIALAVRCSDIVEALDQETLKVTGLTAPRYQLRIDGDEIATFTRSQLEEGVNLAQLDTPMKKQAMQVHRLTRERNEVQFGRWRQVEVALERDVLPNKQAALDTLGALEKDLYAKQHAAAQPSLRHYELLPAKE
jgi:lysophospholipase L1-like esterase